MSHVPKLPPDNLSCPVSVVNSFICPSEKKQFCMFIRADTKTCCKKNWDLCIWQTTLINMPM